MEWKFAPNSIKTGLTTAEYGEAKSGDHLRRAAAFTNPFSKKAWGMQKENVLNSVGLLTSEQKRIGGLMNKVIGATGAGFIGYTMLTGGRMEDAASMSLSGVGFLAGLRPAKEVGHGIAKAFGAGRMGSYGAGLITGGVVGAAVGLTLGAIPYAADNNNAVQKFASSVNKPTMFNEVSNSRDSLTQRQKMIQKLSKSGLNDRGQLLGNESLIIRGIL